VLNCFRLLGMLRGDYVSCTSSGRLALADILDHGVRGAPDVDAVATRDDGGMSILCWHYHDEDVPGPDAVINLDISVVSAPSRVRRFSVDAQHSNAYGAWQQMGEPQRIEGSRLAQLQDAAKLAETEAPQLTWQDGRLTGSISLPRQGATVIRLEF
jgi:xylan 1,4-beta-xylosidase